MITAIMDNINKINVNLRNFYHPGQAKTGNVHPGHTQKFRKQYTLSHLNYVSQALQGRRVPPQRPYLEIDLQILK